MKERQTDAKIDELLDTLDQKILRLRNEYEQFFSGVVKREPVDKREEVAALIRRIGRERIYNTAQKFRYQQLRARFTSFSTYWNRTVKQLEEGTHRRDLFRVRLREQVEKEQQSDRAQITPKGAGKPSKKQTVDTVQDPGALKQVFQDFLATRQKCRERTDNVQFDKMVQFMQSQTQTIKKQFGCQAVRFEVVEDQGKAKLKAIPVKRR